MMICNAPVKAPGQTTATCQRNISQHPVATCYEVLGVVGSNLTNFKPRANNTQHVATHRTMAAKRTQYVVPNNVAMCSVDALRSFGLGFTLKITFLEEKISAPAMCGTN